MLLLLRRRQGQARRSSLKDIQERDCQSLWMASRRRRSLTGSSSRLCLLLLRSLLPLLPLLLRGKVVGTLRWRRLRWGLLRPLRRLLSLLRRLLRLLCLLLRRENLDLCA